MKYLPILLIALATAFVSCKKEHQNAVSGKWQETKLVVNVYSSNVVVWDTTYLSPFTKFDYLQFNNNGSCIIGGDFNFIAKSGSPGYSEPIQTTPGTSNFSYATNGSVYVLTSTNSQPVNFAGAFTTDTVSIHGNTLLQHVVNYIGPGVNSTYDSYFTRQ